MGPLTVEDSVLFSADDVFLSSDLVVLLLLLDSDLSSNAPLPARSLAFFVVLLLPVMSAY